MCIRDSERGHEAEEGQDRVALLEREEHLDSEDGAERRRQAEPARGDREEDVRGDENPPLEGRARAQDLPAGWQAQHGPDGADQAEQEQDAVPDPEAVSYTHLT